MSLRKPPIVLVHGLWLSPRAWESFRDLYDRKGYVVYAPAWPGMEGEVDEIRRDPSEMRGIGVREVVDHYESFIRELSEPPIIVGHSFGGLIVQMLLDRGLGVAGVALDPAPPKGVFRLPFTALKSSLPVLKNPFNLGRTVALTLKQFLYSFANNVSIEEGREAYAQYSVPGPGRPVFQVAFANLTPDAATRVDFRNSTRAPLLLIAGTEDHQVPASMVRENYRRYSKSKALTDFREFPNRSHLLFAQDGWEEVAEYALDWAERYGRGALGLDEPMADVGPGRLTNRYVG